jgi:hypothetical protein
MKSKLYLVTGLAFILIQAACKSQSNQNDPNSGSELANVSPGSQKDPEYIKSAVGTVVMDFETFRKNLIRFEPLMGPDRFQYKSQADSIEVQLKVGGTIGKNVYCEQPDFLDSGSDPQLDLIARRGNNGQTKIEVKGYESYVFSGHRFSKDLKYCAENNLISKGECYGMVAKEGLKGEFYFQFRIGDSNDFGDSSWKYVLAIEPGDHVNEPGDHVNWHALAWYDEEDGSNGCRASNNLNGLLPEGLYKMISAIGG